MAAPWDKTKGVEYRSVGNVYGEVSFLKNFTWRSTFYADMSTVNRRTYTPRYYGYNPRTDEVELYSQVTGVNESDQNWRKFQQDHLLTFKKNLGSHGDAGCATRSFRPNVVAVKHGR